jgi:hypothetical protein
MLLGTGSSAISCDGKSVNDGTSSKVAVAGESSEVTGGVSEASLFIINVYRDCLYGKSSKIQKF